MLGSRFGAVQQHTSSSPTPPLTNLILWLDGADPAGNGVIPSNGAAQASWVDKSGTGNTFSQANGALQPTYKTSFLNSKGVMEFTATSSQSFNASAGTSFPTTGARTLFVLWYFKTNGQYGSFYYGNNGNAANQFTLLKQTIPNWNCRVGASYSGGTNATSTWYRCVLNSNASTGSSDYTLDVNSSSVSLSGAGGTINTTNSSPMVGGFAASNFLDGYIAEVLYYNSALNSGQVAAVNSYLITKWGV